MVRGHTKPVMPSPTPSSTLWPSQIQWPCPELGLHIGWFWEGKAVVVSSDRNVVNESNKAIVENKDMKYHKTKQKDANKFFANNSVNPSELPKTIKNVKEYIISYRDTPMESQDTMNLFRIEKSPNLTSIGL